jgi:hypothetical protein
LDNDEPQRPEPAPAPPASASQPELARPVHQLVERRADVRALLSPQHPCVDLLRRLGVLVPDLGLEAFAYASDGHGPDVPKLV